MLIEVIKINKQPISLENNNKRINKNQKSDSRSHTRVKNSPFQSNFFKLEVSNLANSILI
jgi:hypothetical protein